MHLPEATSVLVDGEVGNVYVDPSTDIISRFEARDRARREVAEQVGFSDPSAFHRSFKKWTGQSPMEYREAQQPG